jgi:hypothetical protein
MWRYLQRNAVENNLFMLNTNSKDLVDFSIDKYMAMDREDPNFQIYRSKVINEAKENIWFYFRELVVVPDETSLTGYKHFELTPKSMMLIYLYQKKKSFININNDEELCLYFLWNLHKSLYNTDLVLVNNNDKVTQISDVIKNYIAQMQCPVPFGSTQIMSDGLPHFLNCGLSRFSKQYCLNRQVILMELIDQMYDNYMKRNDWVESTRSLFVLENDLPTLSYSYILNSITDKCRFYLNGRTDPSSIDTITLNNFLQICYPYADTSMYDITDDTDLSSIYLI